MKTQQTILIIVGIILFVLAVYMIYGTFIHRDEIDIVIDDRYWSWSKSYTYSVTTYTMGCSTIKTKDSDGNVISETTTCGMTPSTTTYTRCSNTSSGRELPTIAPALSCYPAPGDIEHNNVGYYVVYHEQETDKQVTSSIAQHTWAEYAPKTSMTVTVNLFGGIVQ